MAIDLLLEMLCLDRDLYGDKDHTMAVLFFAPLTAATIFLYFGRRLPAAPDTHRTSPECVKSSHAKQKLTLTLNDWDR